MLKLVGVAWRSGLCRSEKELVGVHQQLTLLAVDGVTVAALKRLRFLCIIKHVDIESGRPQTKYNTS